MENTVQSNGAISDTCNRLYAMHLPWFTAPVLAVPLLSACLQTAQYTPVEIHDNGASIATFRTDWLPRRQLGSGAVGEVRDGIEFQYTSANGGDQQSLDAGRLVKIGGATVSGPQQLVHQVALGYEHVAYSGMASIGELPLEVDALMGVGHVDYRLRSTTGASFSLQTGGHYYALSMGMCLRWRFTPKVAAEGRVVFASRDVTSYFTNSFGSGTQDDIMMSELVMAYRPLEQLIFRVGYAQAVLAPKRTAGSALDFRLEGPYVGLGVPF